MTSNYPILTNSLTNAPINQGNYLVIENDTTNDHFYSFITESISDNEMAALTQNANLVSLTDGSVGLAATFVTTNLQSIPNTSGPMANCLSFISTPTQRVLYQIPADSVAVAYYKNNTTAYTDLMTSNSMTALQNYQNNVEIYGIGSYIDYVDGTIFTSVPTVNSTPHTMYPVGYSVNQAGLAMIQAQFSNSVVQWNNGVPLLLTPTQLATMRLNPTSATTQTTQSYTPAPVAGVTAKKTNVGVVNK